MAGHVISHRQPRRKRVARAGAGRMLVRRRFGALAITVAALGAASWLAPYLYRSPAPPAADFAEAPALAKPPPAAPTKVVRRAAPEVTPARAHRPRRARPGVPLDARPERPTEDFEILSAAELDAISQARP